MEYHPLNLVDMIIKILNVKSFLKGQLELYKIEFSETGKEDYFHVMSELKNAIDCIELLTEKLRISIVNNKTLKEENENLKRQLTTLK